MIKQHREHNTFEMNLISKILALAIFMFVPCVQTAFHSIVTFYTQLDSTGQDLFALTEVDGQKVFYNDSKIKKLTHKQEWVKKLMSDERWNKEIQNREKMHEICEKNIHTMKRHLDSKQGRHNFQRTYGCKWNDETEDVEAFDSYGYNGEDFISLDMQKKEYIAFSPHALHTRDTWNRDEENLVFLEKYYREDCVFWLKEILNYGQTAFEKTVPPEVYLLQTDPDSPVMCHVTGFYPAVNIIWITNPSCKTEVQTGEVLPNEDETFQQSAALMVSPDDWHRWMYYCQVTYNGVDKNVWKVVSKHDHKVKRNVVWNKGMIIGLSVAGVVVVAGAVICAINRFIRPRRGNY